jgi:Ca-activated chloride channel family protein
MIFLWPAMLWFLLTIPLLVALYVRILRRRKQFAVRYGNFGLLHEASGQGPGLRRHLPATLFLVGITILGVALARPQMVLSLPAVEGTVILAFDISGSMAATDMTPTRMEVAKAVARDFVARQPVTVQMGIVAFSDSGISVQPPTNDQAAILASLNRLEPQRGTSLGNGISAALETIAQTLGQVPEDSGDFDPELLPTPTPVPEGTYSSAEIILLTDGENNLDPNPLEAAQQAADRGVRVHTIGVGSPTGIDLEVNGFTVHTQLDEAMLQQISAMTGGNYYLATTEEDLRTIYDSLQPQLTTKPEKTEITSILAGISSLVLLAGGMLSLLWFGRMP